MTTIEELKAKQAKELAELEQELKIRDALSALLPSVDIGQCRVCLHGYSKPHASVALWNEYQTTHKLDEAAAIIETIKERLIECYHWKSGCVSTWPDEINSYANDEHAVMDGSHTVEIRVKGGRGYGPDTVVQCWLKLAGIPCELRMPVSDLWKLLPQVKVSYTHHGEVSKGEITWPVEAQCVDKFRSWSGRSQLPSYDGSYYFADVPNFLAFASNFTSKKEQVPA